MKVIRKNCIVAGMVMATVWVHSGLAGVVTVVDYTNSSNAGGDRSDYTRVDTTPGSPYDSSTLAFDAGNSILTLPAASTGGAGSHSIYGGVTSFSATETVLDPVIALSGNELEVNGPGSGNINLRSLLIWDSADYISEASAFGTSGTSMTIDVNRFQGGFETLRLVIRNGASYYISSFSTSSTAPQTITGDQVGLQWASFNPANFDSWVEDLGGFSFSDQSFGNVTGVGFITAQDRNGLPIFELDSFSATLYAPVPEPSSLALLVGGGLLIAATRRRKSQSDTPS